MGSASGEMKIVHVNAIRWAGPPKWAGIDTDTHAQIILAPNQLFSKHGKEASPPKWDGARLM